MGLLVADLLKQLAAEWLDEITDTRLDRLAAVLANGGTAAELEAAINAVLADQHSAQMIAQTELNRADNAARMAAFRADRVYRVRWVTTSANPCPECVMNRDAGPWPLGHPFPSGVIMPPDHPHCQCHLEPA
ncbi:phage minor head protein [Trebonia kvetii]|uniref:phage minor head protein n=1 Tax=Trebonia kvetii TaxID=2480626 RepID=UPI0016520E12|nr:phage minor head protein [Trebonia kvetii]